MILTGIVLSGFNLKEEDKIIKVFSKELGIISIYCYRINNIKNNFRNACDLFSISLFEVNKNRDMYQLIYAEVLDNLFYLRDHFEPSIYANILVEITERIIFDDYPELKIYEMLKKSLIFLTKTSSDTHMLLVSAYLLKLSALLGIKPILTDQLNNRIHKFSHQKGGITSDSACDHYLNDQELKYMNLLIYSTFEKIILFQINKSMQKKIFRISLDYLKYYFNIHQINSEKFLNYITGE